MKTISYAKGDGIGPEIMDATLHVLQAAKAPLRFQEVHIGYKVYQAGNPTGLAEGTIENIRKNGVFLKAPIITPQGGGNKSVTVTLRKSLGLYANVRPSRAYTPYVSSHFPTMDLVVVRENEEDLYTGIEYQQTAEMVQGLKLISRPGTERIIRYAFAYARTYGRHKVCCMTKDNIMKQTDGLFHQIFDEVASEYPDIESEHMIIDIGAALIAAQPERFDVVVTLNLYGDILTDISSQISGSVGLGGSFNMGSEYAMFEAVHGAAPDIAGKGVANPSGLLQASCLMLLHLGYGQIAANIQNALLSTLEDGIHTADIANAAFTKERVGTTGFVEALINRLGRQPKQLAAVQYPASAKPVHVQIAPAPAFQKRLVGIDIYLDWPDKSRDPRKLFEALLSVHTVQTRLEAIANRGMKVNTEEPPLTDLSDHWVCRFLVVAHEHDSGLLHKEEILQLLQLVDDAGLDFIKVENLYYINGKRGFALFQGE